MFEFIVIVLLGLIVFSLYRKKPEANAPIYDGLSGQHGEFLLYTVAEFSESQHVDYTGIIKELSLSNFIFAMDEKSKRIKTAHVKFVGKNLAARKVRSIGSYEMLGEDDSYLGIEIWFTLAEYDAFIAKIKAATKGVGSQENSYFLFKMTVSSGVKDKTSISGIRNLIYEINEIGVYNEYYADKISVMYELENGLLDNDSEYRARCKEIKNRFLETLNNV